MNPKLSKLAFRGGPKAKTVPYGTGKRYLDNEGKYLLDALDNNVLFYGLPNSKWVKRACEMMKTYTGKPFVAASSSCSAAIQRFMQTGIRLLLNQFFTEQDIDETAQGVRKVFEAYAK